MSSAEITSTTTCKNCQTTFEGKFCPNCAQKADTHRFTLKHFGHEFLHSLTHTDKGAFLLMKELLFRPGKVAREYNSGMRKKYFNPITFLLIITAIQIFAVNKTDFYIAFNTAIKQLTEQIPLPAEERKQFDQSFKDADKQSAMIAENDKAITLLVIPLLGFFTWIFFKKSGHNYAETLVFNVLLIAGMTLIFLILSFIPFLILPSFVVIWMLVYYPAILIYSLVAYKQFYNQHWPATIAKGILLQILLLVSMQLVSYLVLKIV